MAIGEPRARRATDAILLVIATVALAAISAAAVPPPAFVRALGRFLASFPQFLDGVWQVAADLLLVLAGFLVVSALVRRRLAVARDMVLAAVLAAMVGIVVGRVVHGAWPDVWQALRTAAPPAWYPSPASRSRERS